MLVTLLTAGGWGWLALHMLAEESVIQVPGACIIKQTTGFPCPSCGTTRAVHLLVNGDVKASLLSNPNGVLAGIALLVVPLLLLTDLLAAKSTIPAAYAMVETVFRKRWVQIAGIVLVLLNWWWNIEKGL